MKFAQQSRPNGIEVSVWQLVAILVAAIGCLFALVPLVSQYRSSQCKVILVKDTIVPPAGDADAPLNDHRRYVRQAPVDQCSVVPPMCPAITTAATGSSTVSTTTRRSTVSTVSATRPVITAATTTRRTTTPNPWANTTRPYDSWRLPSFAVPIDYTLRLSCPDCFTLVSAPATMLFYGQLTMRINVLAPTSFLVLHAKNLNIARPTVTSGGPSPVNMTYLPEFEMVHLSFGASALPAGVHSIQINYTGLINQQDQTGFYRDTFWKSLGESSYLLAGNLQPIHARRVFPCFDEPQMPARFILTLEHPQNSTIALSNSPPLTNDSTSTTFQTTPVLATHAFTWAILPRDEFQLTTRTASNTTVNIWVRPELSGIPLDQAFDVIEKTLAFAQSYLNTSNGTWPTKLDLIGVPDLILDARASSSWGLLAFREEYLSADASLNSAERQQSTTKTIAEQILQIWFTKIDWWNNVWFGKSLSVFLAYKMIDQSYPQFNFMEQFPVREMVPFMMNDAKPSTRPVSNANLISNEQILDCLSPSVVSKGASLLRLLEHILGANTFQAAVIDAIQSNNGSDALTGFYSNMNTGIAVNSSVTVPSLLRTWLEERNYPIVTVDVVRNNDTTQNTTTLVFRQSRYLASPSFNTSALTPNYLWNIYLECQLGGSTDGNGQNLTSNVEMTTRKFLLETPTTTVELKDVDFLWIKCNKDFYSYVVTEYVTNDDDQLRLYDYFELLFNTDVLSNNDKANLIQDTFVLPHGGDIVNYDQTVALVRRLVNNPSTSLLPWSVFVWHWNYLMGVEEHSKYFWNFKQFGTRQILSSFSFEVNNIVQVGATHQDRLLRTLLFDLLCRIQNPDALNKATELFRRIPASYFYNSTGIAGVPADFLSTAVNYHLQNANDIDEWDYLWWNITENQKITSQQRQTFLRALGASKDIWRLKFLLETAIDTDANLIRAQEFFDLIGSVSENPIGRDVVWNFYRHSYDALLTTFGSSNLLFDQLITNIAQSFENQYYYFQMMNFIQQYPSPFLSQQIAVDQILMNFEWLVDSLAENLDEAITGTD